MSKKVKDIAFITLFAAGVGYIAGILTAPKSGKETRKDIADAAVKAKTATEKRLKQLHAELNELIEEGKRRAGPLGAAAKQELETLVSRAFAAKEKVRQLLSSLHEGESNDKELDAVTKEVNTALNDLKAYMAKHEEKS